MAILKPSTLMRSQVIIKSVLSSLIYIVLAPIIPYRTEEDQAQFVPPATILRLFSRFLDHFHPHFLQHTRLFMCYSDNDTHRLFSTERAISNGIGNSRQNSVNVLVPANIGTRQRLPAIVFCPKSLDTFP